MPRVSVSLAPLLGQNASRISDHKLGGTYLRGGFNVTVVDGEWWCRKGEGAMGTTQIRYASTPWWWVLDASGDAAIIANPFWALQATRNGVRTLYGPDVNESMTLTNGSTIATSSTTRTVNQLVLVEGTASQTTTAVYRITAVSGTQVTLERPYEGATGAVLCDFIDPLPRNSAGSAVSYSLTFSSPIRGSAVLFEQLVTNAAGPAAGSAHGASPATTAGNTYLIITSAFGMPVAIDVTAALAGSPAAALRLWLYQTGLSSPSQIPSNANTGLYATVYKDRLLIGAAPDAGGDYGDRTIWWSQVGDLTRWHTGIAGQTAAGNFKTFSGVRNGITALAPIADQIVVHRETSQEVGSSTSSNIAPFSFRTNSQGLGIGDRDGYVSNRCVVANGLNYIWTQQGPAVFDGGRVTPIARDAVSDLLQYSAIRGPYRVANALLDEQRGLIYWVISGAVHQDSTSAALVTTPAGTLFLSRCNVWVYDYLNDTSWFEDHPGFYGGGMSEVISGDSTPVLMVSRFDGTLLVMSAADNAKDPSLANPGDTSQSLVPAAQCDTPWINFGNNARKTIGKIEVVLRGFNDSTSGSFDVVADVLTSVAYLRLRVFGDFNEATTIADVETVYDAQGNTDRTGNRQEPLFVLRFTPKCSARTFKFRFSNTLTTTGSTAGYEMAPFRINDVVVYFSQHESDQANAYDNE